jgi:hypothetical protein
MEPIVKTLLFLCLATLSQQVPLEWESSQCSQSCYSDPKFLRYDLGKTYVYKLESQSLLSGPTQQQMAFQSTVEVSVHSNCDLTLQLRQTKVVGTDPQTALSLANQLDEQPITFGYNDGVVTDVCPSQDDQQWTIDVKKAIISSLQMSARSLEQKTIVLEKDILGECETTYQPIGRRFTTQQIIKTKQLNRCQKRQSSLIGLFPRNYGYASYTQLPYVNATYECQQTLDKDLITAATCREDLQLRGTGIQIENQLNIRFEKQINGLATRRARQFQKNNYHLQMAPRFQTQSQDLVQILRTISQQLENERQELTVESFPELIESISQTKQLQRIWRSVDNHEISSNNQLSDLFLDALALSQSEESSQILLEVYQSGRVTPERAGYLFSLLAFNSNPNPKQIKTFVPILKSSETPKHVVLGITGLIHNAKHYLPQQQTRDLIQTALDNLLQRLSSSRDDSQSVATIRAIENIGIENHLTVRQELVRIAKDQKKSNYLRSAAIKVLSEGIDDNQRRDLLEVFKRDSETNEIRINSYKSLVMSGISRQQLEEIQQKIKREVNKDIQQYVRSHQKNLKESSDPHKKYVLPYNAPQFQQPSNQWFGVSNNFETSFMFDALGMGVAVEADVIHARGHSPLPRSVTFNLTVPAFGRELQVFEIEFRQKGFQNVFQSFQRYNGQNLVQRMIKEALDVVQYPQQWSNQIQSGDLQLQFNVKVDGKTILSVALNDVQQDYGHIWNKLRQQLEQRIDIQRAFAVQPINTRLQLPTTNGLPVIVRLNATFVSTLNANLKVSDLSRNSNNKVVDAFIAPSLALQFEAGLEFIAQNHKKSLEFVSRVSSSPVWDSKMEIRENRILNMKINLPKDKQSLFRVQNQIYERDQNGVRRHIQQSSYSSWFQYRRQYKTCTQSLNKVLGIQFCSEMTANNYEISVEKSDRTMKSFELSLERPSSQGSDLKTYRFNLNTPNSQVDRNLLAEIQLETPSSGRKSLKIEIRSPWMRYSVEGGVRNEEKEQSIQLSVEREGRKQFSLDFGLEQQQRGQKREFRPRIRVQLGERAEVVAMQGSVSVMKGRKNQLQINLEGNQKQFLKGSFVREGERKSQEMRVSSDLTISLPNIELRLNGMAEKGQKNAETDLTIEYRLKNQKKESIKFSSKLQNLTQSQLTKLSAFSELTSTQMPSLNFHLAYNLLFKPKEQMENEFTFSWTQQLKNKIHLLHVSKLSLDKMENSLNVEISPLNVNYELRANGQVDGSSRYTTEVVGKDRTGRKENDIKVNFQYKHISRSPLHLTLDLNLKTQNREMSYRDELKELSRGEYQGQTWLQWAKGQRAQLDYNYKLKDSMDHEMDFKLKTPANHVIRHSGLLKLSRNEFQLKSKLNSNENQIYSFDSQLSRVAPSQLDAQSNGYVLKVNADPYHVPQLASLEFSTPNAIQHKTYLEFIPKTSFSLKSDSKQNQKNIFAIDSHISRTTPSRVVVNSQPIEGRLDYDVVNDQRSAQLLIKSPTQDWTHSSSLNYYPKQEIQLKSKTLVSGQPLVNFDGQLTRSGQQYVTILGPNKSSLSAKYNNREKNGNLELLVNDWKHKTDFDLKNQIRLNSETNHERKQLNSFQYNYNPLNGVHALNSQLNGNLKLEVEGKHWNSPDDQIVEPFLSINAQNKQFETNARIARQQNNLKIQTKVLKNSENIADFNALLNRNPYEESVLSYVSPQITTQLKTIPKRETKFEWNGPQVNHVTHVLYPESEYSLDSKTQFKNYPKYWSLYGRHNLQMSLVSTKNPYFDSELELNRLEPRTKVVIQSNVQNYPYNHVTEVVRNNGNQWKVDSKTEKLNENLFSLNGEYNHVNSPSLLTVNYGKQFEIRSRAQPFGPQKSLSFNVKNSQKYLHSTDVNLDNKSLTLKSRTDSNSGKNLLKIDSYLTPNSERSHVSLVSPQGVANLEFEPNSRARLEFNAVPYEHNSEISRTESGIRFNSKTSSQGLNLLDINSVLSQELSHFSVISPQIESQLLVNPKKNSGNFEIKTEKLFHKTEVQNSVPNNINFDSNTEYKNQLLAKISAKLNQNTNNNQFFVEIPHFSAKSQLNWNEGQGSIDYKSKLPKGRHLLASIAFNPNSQKGFHSDIAWDLDSDPNQRLIIDVSARQEGSSWAKKQLIYGLDLNYAGNDVKVLSSMTSNDILNGPHELSVDYTPKFNPKRDSLSLNLKHVIQNNQMQCNLDYTESQKLKFGAKLNARFLDQTVGQSGVELSLETTAPSNRDLEVKVTFNERHSDLKRRNSEIFAELKAIRSHLNEEYLISGSVRREDQIKGNVRIETPSVGRKDMEFVLNDKELTFYSQNESGKQLELNAKFESRSAQLELKSNVRGIPSVSVVSQYSPQEVSLIVDLDQQRKVDFVLRQSGSSLSSGLEFDGRLDTSFWPKYELKSSLKQNSREIDFEFNAKYSEKQIFYVILNAKRESELWSGNALISLNGAEVAKASIESNFGSNSLSYILNTKTQYFSPISLKFSFEKVSANERKVSLSFSSNGQSVADVKTAWKLRHNDVIPERAWLSVTKLGTNFEIKTSLMEQIEDNEYSNSILGLTKNQKVYEKIRNQFLVSINSHSIGFDHIMTSRDSRNRAFDSSLKLLFPSNRFIQLKSDFLSTNQNQELVFKTQITRDVSIDGPLLETTFRVQNTDQRIRFHTELTSNKFQRSPKVLEFDVQKPYSGNSKLFSGKVFLDFSQNPNNALTIEADVNQRSVDQKLSRYSNQKNTTLNLALSTRDKRLVDFQLSGHVSKQSFGINYVNTNRRGQKREGTLFVQQLDNNQNERRFEAILANNDNRYKVLGNLAQNSNELNLRVFDERSGHESDVRVAAANQCLQWEQRSGDKVELRYDLCANFNNRDDKIVSLSLENQNQKEFDLNLEIDSRNQKSLKLDLNWNPNYLNEIRAPSGGQYNYEYLRELYQELSHKSEVVSQQISEEVILPFASLISDEFQDVFQELAKNFGPYNSLAEYYQQLTSSVQRLADYWSYVFAQVVPSSVDQYFSQIYRNVRKQCKRSENCYKIIYALENYGWDSTWDVLLSNAQQWFSHTHRWVMTSSGKLYRFVPSIPDWLQTFIEDYRQSIQQSFDAIIDSNEDLRQFVRYLSIITSEISKQNSNEINWNSIKEAFNQIFEIVFNSQKTSSKVLIWDPKRGRAQFEIRSPVIQSRKLRNVINDVSENIQQNQNWNQIKSMFF